jgi:site-specific DNA-methyltransferase (adenine-specific)
VDCWKKSSDWVFEYMIETPEINRLYEGDSLQLMADWPDNFIDHCIVDPPFNMSKKNGLGWAYSSHVTMSETWDQFPRENYLEFSRTWIKQVSRVVRENGNIFIFGTYHNIYDIGFILNEMGLRIVNSIVWFKPNAQPNITCRMLTESTEYIIWACNAQGEKAKNWVFNYEVAKQLNDGKQMRNMWSIPYTPKKEKQFGKHPTQKPAAIIARMILIASRPGDILLDCFAGTGTTGAVAQQLGRKWVMIENRPEYVEIAKNRLSGPLELPAEIIQAYLENRDTLAK